MSALLDLLSSYRNESKTEREKGTYFELLIKDFLKHDPTFSPQFSDVWTYAEWANLQGIDSRDTGIDLVAKLSEDDGFCAIQCKFYEENHKIQKSDLDSFFTASGKKQFTRRLIVDTTRREWSEHAEAALSGQTVETQRIGLHELENSPIDWSVYAPNKPVKLKAKKQLRDHQIAALDAVEKGLAAADRGKMVMACGTGKTFTALKIAEKLAGSGKQVLYLVPSLSLMSQSITEWTIESATPLRSFAVCSDNQVGKRKNSDDLGDINVHDLVYPATTDVKTLAAKIEHPHDGEMTVIFSTYQSIQVISEAQKQYGLPAFDLIICDEAHRTTGATLAGEYESNFVRIHDQGYIAGAKRLYMTATPRIFGDAIKTKANEVDATLASMDNPALYGETLYELSFSYAVQKGLLTDYKVLVLAVDEATVSAGVQKRLTDSNNELILDDATKIIGCYRALSKLDVKADVVADPNPMRRAVAFCRDIKSSKAIKSEFTAVVDEYLINQPLEAGQTKLTCEVDHVDGTYNATARNALLSWLKEDAAENTCRILSNARCLSEGVDVPALDAILFLHPRKSQIDVVQSVGRVMRRAEGKSMGYVILPIGVPAGVKPEDALNDNEKFRVVWQILNALRAHDDRFDATINKMDLGVNVSDHIEIIAVSNTLPEKQEVKKETPNIGTGGSFDNDNESFDSTSNNKPSPGQKSFVFDEFQKAIYAKIVQKCGKRDYWENWANDIARIAQTHVTRITALLQDKQSKEYQAFAAFLEELRDDLNESITETEAIEMLAQHIITKPVFDALFEGYSFTQHNPVSLAMQGVLDILQKQNLEKETETLKKFYESVKMRATGIDNGIGKQRIIVELYDKFFKNAFPKMTERLGIVYTPVEVVDFIIHSVNEALQSEFGLTLGSKDVHIIDPFTGTGTFITRLLQSGLISKDQLAYKYQNEIHANEIVLLAYYIAAINIEAVYHSIMGGAYQPFNGICLTDTFALHEKGNTKEMHGVQRDDNSSRRRKQTKLDIRVIMGNPPYSAGQTSANDNNANVSYPWLDDSIRTTYAAQSTATNKNALYDSYIRAIRWASNRIGNSGVIGFVTNAGFIEANTADGLRKCLADEFSSIYIFHLRGNQRTSGELSRKEGGKIFGSGSRAPIAISILIKSPNAAEHGRIYLHDIGDYLSREDKLTRISGFRSLNGITDANGWMPITPDKHNDWVSQRDTSFDQFISLGDKKDRNSITVFDNYSSGVKTNRDAWCYNFSQTMLSSNMRRMVDFYNAEVKRYKAACQGLNKSQYPDIDGFINTDSSRISWNRGLKNDLARHVQHPYQSEALRICLYRPFTKSHMYFDKYYNDMLYQMPRIFPNVSTENRVIWVTGTGATLDFTCFISNMTPDLQGPAKIQCFPLKLYEKNSGQHDAVEAEDFQDELFAAPQSSPSTPITCEYTVKDGIADEGLSYFQTAYPTEAITKEDVFYYIYGLLHSEDYKSRYADNLTKELPRIPCVKKASDFWAFSKAGRDLAELHINYESVDLYPVNYAGGSLFRDSFVDKDYHVEQMKFGKSGKVTDKSTVIYNHKITMTNIPLEAYEYVVNGKPALEWVMERQAVTTHKDSGIVNDANLWAIETMHDAAYPLKLFQRVITVSLETMKIVKALPRLDIAVTHKW